jgi:hypothetical protein
MLLATTTVEDFDRFTSVFSTAGAGKRGQHGSKGAHVFRDPNQDDRVRGPSPTRKYANSQPLQRARRDSNSRPSVP